MKEVDAVGDDGGGDTEVVGFVLRSFVPSACFCIRGKGTDEAYLCILFGYPLQLHPRLDLLPKLPDMRIETIPAVTGTLVISASFNEDTDPAWPVTHEYVNHPCL